jgi:hypothetical protein
MKTRFWNVGIEIYKDGTVKAGVLRSREEASQPSDAYRLEPRREIFSVWFVSNAEAQGAVMDALAMNTVQEEAAA